VKSGLDETATYVLSSGSTGQPKAIIKTNRNLLTTVEATQHREMTELTPNEIQLSSNFSHVSGQRYLISAINGGAQLAIVRVDENLDDVYGNIHKYNITSAFLIPTQLNYLVKNVETIDRDYLKSLRDVVTGAAPIPETTFRCVVDKFKFKKFRICELKHLYFKSPYVIIKIKCFYFKHRLRYVRGRVDHTNSCHAIYRRLHMCWKSVSEHTNQSNR